MKRSRLKRSGSKARKTRTSKISDYVVYGDKNFKRLRNVPPAFAKSLLTGFPNVDPNDRQNDSPTMRKMVSIVERYNGTLEGYQIPVETGRDDARITFDGFTIKASKENALKLKAELEDWEFAPSEFDEVKPNQWRFWWD